jgi:hypothetical protein
MTVIADSEKRVVLPQAQPGERFDVQASADGFVLRKPKSVSAGAAKVSFINETVLQLQINRLMRRLCEKH